MSELLAGFTGRWDRRIEAVEGVEIWVIWSRRRDAWTYLGGADAGWRRNSGLSYPERSGGLVEQAPRIAYRNESNYSQGR